MVDTGDLPRPPEPPASQELLQNEPLDLLVVEDNKVVSDLYEAIFGFSPDVRNVHVAASLGEAREVINGRRAVKPNAVLLDGQLPDGNGLDFATEIHEIDPTIPIVMISGGIKNSQGVTVLPTSTQLESNHIGLFIPKPAAPSQLEKLVTYAKAERAKRLASRPPQVPFK